MIQRISLIFLFGILTAQLSSCSSSLFKGDKDKKNQSSSQASQDDDDDDDCTPASECEFSEGDNSEDDNVPEWDTKKIEGMKFVNIKSESLRTETGTDDDFLGTKIKLWLYKIGTKKVSKSIQDQTLTTFIYGGKSDEVDVPIPHKTTFGKRGLCPQTKKKLVYKIQILKGGSEDITGQEKLVIGARVDKKSEINIGIADRDGRCSPQEFHEIDTWIIKFSCPDKNQIQFTHIPCWDTVLENNPAIYRECWASEKDKKQGCPSTSWPNSNKYDCGEFPAECR